MICLQSHTTGFWPTTVHNEMGSAARVSGGMCGSGHWTRSQAPTAQEELLTSGVHVGACGWHGSVPIAFDAEYSGESSGAEPCTTTGHRCSRLNVDTEQEPRNVHDYEIPAISNYEPLAHPSQTDSGCQRGLGENGMSGARILALDVQRGDMRERALRAAEAARACAEQARLSVQGIAHRATVGSFAHSLGQHPVHGAISWHGQEVTGGGSSDAVMSSDDCYSAQPSMCD